MLIKSVTLTDAILNQAVKSRKRRGAYHLINAYKT